MFSLKHSKKSKQKKQAQERQMMEQWYYQYRQLMYHVAYDILQNTADAEDVVEESFYIISKNFNRISEIPCQEQGAYFVILTRNTAINLYNKNRRRFQHITEIQREWETGIRVDQFEDFAESRLTKLIAALPKIYQDILYLRYLEGYEPNEIAKMLDISIDTVYKRSERAKKLLLEKLKEEDTNE